MITKLLNKIYQGLEWRFRQYWQNFISSPFYSRICPTSYKEHAELAFWKGKVAEETLLRNEHYEVPYTQFFNLEKEFYRDKRILDIGCGPRGSLEWASMAAERVGLDPLANEYLKLGAMQHEMTYVNAPSENIPYPNDYFDVISSFNSLDHVADFARTATEIKRVLKPGGLFLLIVEVNHEATVCEPITLTWETDKEFADQFITLESRRYEIGDHNIYGQLRKDARYDSSNLIERPGILAAKMSKINKT